MKFRSKIAASLLCCALIAPVAPAYIRMVDSSGAHMLFRTDNAAIQFYTDEKIAPGLKNRDGQLFIAADSTPVAALKQALLSWQANPKANLKFLPLKTTSGGPANDGKNVIYFQDNDIVRAATDGTNAVTINYVSTSDYHILDSDVLFNPRVTFSTTGAAETVDIEAVLAHEIGHVLGANHNNLLGATMFQAFSKNVAGSPLGVFPRALSMDEAAFASAVYPASGAALGTISGTVSIAGGGPAKSALITFFDTEAGCTLGTLAGPDGHYSLVVPTGSYQIYAEPFNSIVQPGNLYLSSAVAVDKSWKAGFYGGTAAPAVVAVGAGGTETADIQVAAGATALSLKYLVTAGAGGQGDLSQISTYNGPRIIDSGTSVDLVMVGNGLDASFVDANSTVRVLGQGVTVRPGSLRTDLSYVGQGFLLLRATLDVAPRAKASLASVFLSKGPETLALSGALVLVPTKPVFTAQSVTNSASFVANGVSPGEIVSLFGANLGSPSAVDSSMIGFDPSTGSFPTSLSGVAVTFDGVAAPIFFARNDLVNLQVPFEVSGKATTRVVVSYYGVASDPVDIPVKAFTPGIYTYDGSGKGPGIVVNQDYSLNTSSNPAARGSHVVVYLTGRGAVSYGVQTGKPAASPPAIDAGGFTSFVGSLPATVEFGGWTPTGVGLAQANIVVPGDAPAGQQSLTLSVGGAASQSGVTMFVK